MADWEAMRDGRYLEDWTNRILTDNGQEPHERLSSIDISVDKFREIIIGRWTSAMQLERRNKKSKVGLFAKTQSLYEALRNIELAQ